jgi:hypothetical protein
MSPTADTFAQLLLKLWSPSRWLLTLRAALLGCIVFRHGNREDHVILARFTDSYSAEVYVNPDLVTFIRQTSNDMTTINFGEEHTVTVKMQVAAVASALFSAGKP